MSGCARRGVICFLFSVSYFLPFASANDSTASLGAGGIVLTESADIRMASEDLFISKELVRVRYSFVNETSRPIITRVAFPMPVVDLDALGESDVGWPTDNEANLIDFKVTVGGRAVAPVLEEKAFLKGVEVTDILRRYKLGLGKRPGFIADAIGKLPASARKDLAAKGLTEDSGDYVRPLWTVKSTFHWQQTFPPGPLAVEHTYRPVVGGQMITYGMAIEDPRLLQEGDFYKDFCFDKTTIAGLQAKFRKGNPNPDLSSILFAWVIDYVLTTGKNWKGPIGKFRLTMDKGRPQNLITLCMQGVKKTGATTFVVEKANFEPEQDLRLMIIEAPGASR